MAARGRVYAVCALFMLRVRQDGAKDLWAKPLARGALALCARASCALQPRRRDGAHRGSTGALASQDDGSSKASVGGQVGRVHGQMIESQLQSSLLAEAVARNQTRNRTGNGKFALATGSWFIDDTFKHTYPHGFRRQANGTVVCEYPDTPDKVGLVCGYRLDRRLVPCLADLFNGGSVTELGAGVGLYQRAIQSASKGRITSYTAFEGMPDVETLSRGRVRWADLSAPQRSRIVRSDWAMSLEVAEHIPAQYEANFVDNLAGAASRGLVIAWGQVEGTHHLNTKAPKETLKLFAAHGFCLDANATVTLRRCASFPYHREDLLVVKQRGAGGGATTTCSGSSPAPRPKTYRAAVGHAALL